MNRNHSMSMFRFWCKGSFITAIFLLLELSARGQTVGGQIQWNFGGTTSAAISTNITQYYGPLLQPGVWQIDFNITSTVGGGSIPIGIYADAGLTRLLAATSLTLPGTVGGIRTQSLTVDQAWAPGVLTYYLAQTGTNYAGNYTSPGATGVVVATFPPDDLMLQITADQKRLDQNVRVDPVQLATGAESRHRTLFSFKGARDWDFVLSYNSMLGIMKTGPTPLGRGWSHNFQASITPAGSSLVVQWNTGSKNTFVPLPNNPSTYGSSEDGARYDTITSQPGGGWLLVHRDQSSLLFNASGQLIEDRDAHGRALALTYAGAQLIKISDAVSGTSLSIGYDLNGMIQTLTDASGAASQIGYQLLGGERLLTQITNQNGKQVTLGYDAGLQFKTLTDATGAILTSNTGDSRLRVSTQADGVVGHGVSRFSYATANGLQTTTYTDRNGKVSVHTFDAAFNLLSEKDALNHVTSYTYDSANRVTAVTDPLSRTTSYSYDAEGNVLTATDPAGKVTTFTYDARNNLLTTTDAAGQVTTRTYDTNNNLLTVTDALNHTTTWTYDANSLPLTMTLPGGGIYHYIYTAGRLTTATDPNGVATNFGYDANGRLLYREDALGKRVTFTYDAVGNVLTATNALNQTTAYAYDHRNRVTSVTEPTGAVTAYTYDNNSNILTATDALGKVTTYTYDGEDRLKTVKDALNRITTYNYDDAGRLTSIVDPASNTTTYEYDAAGQLTAVVDALGQRTTSTYDARGLVTGITDPLNRQTGFAYDNLGRRTSATDPLSRVTQFQYDALNRLNRVTDPGSLVAQQGFDVDGNRTSLTNPAANATAFTYDAGGRLTSTTTPEGRTNTYTYDIRSLVATAVEPSGQTTSFSYDAAQRLSSTTDAVGTISLIRDVAGRVLTVSENGKTLTRAYDLLGRLISYTDGDGNVIGYQYDDLGRLTKLTYPDGKQVSYAYDIAGRLSSVTDWAARVTTYSYDAVGRMTQLLRPNGTKQVRTYDAAGQLTQLTELASDGVTVIYSGTHSYDLAGQLTGETLLPSFTLQVTNVAQTVDQDNRLLTHNGAATTFDADGNLLGVASAVAPSNYTYDARNRLTSAGGLGYGYNAENRRVSVTDALGTTSFVVNPNATLDQVLVRTTSNGTKTYYVYGLGLLHEETGGAPSYYHFDRRGDTIALTDATGAVTDRASYDVYGGLLSRTGTINTPFLFNGKWGVQTDANGIYYHRARYYHPQLRRFLNQDVLLGSITAPASLNRFAYATGQPVTGIDPLGLWTFEVYGGAGLAGYLSVGYNDGHLSWRIGIGAGDGIGGGLDTRDKKNEGGLAQGAFEGGLIGRLDVGLPLAGVGVAAELSGAKDECKKSQATVKIGGGANFLWHQKSGEIGGQTDPETGDWKRITDTSDPLALPSKEALKGKFKPDRAGIGGFFGVFIGRQ